MNLFILSENPQLAAEYHCDKHVPKMIVEACQMLSTAHRILDGKEVIMHHHISGTVPPRWRKRKTWSLEDPLLDNVLYKACYINHPCSVWIRDSIDNYIWAVAYAAFLCEEFKLRFGKEHKCFKLINDHLCKTPVNISTTLGRTPFAQAMPSQYKTENAVIAYRNYYFNEKKRFAQWKKNREIPVWWLQMLSHEKISEQKSNK